MVRRGKTVSNDERFRDSNLAHFGAGIFVVRYPGMLCWSTNKKNHSNGTPWNIHHQKNRFDFHGLGDELCHGGHQIRSTPLSKPHWCERCGSLQGPWFQGSRWFIWFLSQIWCKKSPSHFFSHFEVSSILRQTLCLSVTLLEPAHLELW